MQKPGWLAYGTKEKITLSGANGAELIIPGAEFESLQSEYEERLRRCFGPFSSEKVGIEGKICFTSATIDRRVKEQEILFSGFVKLSV
jgi:hypothetical protein